MGASEGLQGGAAGVERVGFGSVGAGGPGGVGELHDHLAGADEVRGHAGAVAAGSFDAERPVAGAAVPVRPRHQAPIARLGRLEDPDGDLGARDSSDDGGRDAVPVRVDADQVLYAVHIHDASPFWCRDVRCAGDGSPRQHCDGSHHQGGQASDQVNGNTPNRRRRRGRTNPSQNTNGPHTGPNGQPESESRPHHRRQPDTISSTHHAYSQPESRIQRFHRCLPSVTQHTPRRLLSNGHFASPASP